MSPEVERALTEFIEREINLHLRVEAIKNELLLRFDWNTHAAFQNCDANHEGFINHNSLKLFQRLNGHFASDEEVVAIVRRLDADADQRINFKEFCDFMKPFIAINPLHHPVIHVSPMVRVPTV